MLLIVAFAGIMKISSDIENPFGFDDEDMTSPAGWAFGSFVDGFAQSEALGQAEA